MDAGEKAMKDMQLVQFMDKQRARINKMMSETKMKKDDDKITIERWELKDVIDTFRMLTQTFPKIKKRVSCLDRQIMKSYARLVLLYNGEKLDYHDFCEYYMGQKDVPKLEEERK